MKNKASTIILGILLIVALVAGLVLVNQNQETRRGAAFANTTLKLLPSSKIEKKVGEVVPVQVWYYTESEAKVDNVQAVVCYGNELTVPETGAVTVNTSNGFNSDAITANKTIGSKKCLVVVASSDKAASALKTTGEAFTINFQAASVGEGTFDINKDTSKVTGNNPAGTNDVSIAITEVVGTTYKISAAATDNTGPEVKFKMTFAGVGEGSKCATTIPVKVVVMGNGAKKEIGSVNTVRTAEKVDGRMVYTGNFKLGNFTPTTNLAVFIKGYKHLQMKYAKDGQDKTYGSAGGELAAGTGTVYDFTKYPALAGDVVNNAGENVQDGWVNVADFSNVKSKANTYEHVDEGGSLLQDLDGSCQVNQMDVSLLVNSLDKKQEELY